MRVLPLETVIRNGAPACYNAVVAKKTKKSAPSASPSAMPSPSGELAGGEAQGESLDTRYGNDVTQSLMREASGGSASEPNPGKAYDSATSGGGGSLPYQGKMEAAFGMDLSGVSAHTGQSAALSGIGANAATRGSDNQIAFADSSPSVETVAHEVAHVAQAQNGGGGGVHAESAVSSPASRAERAAADAGRTVAAGGSVDVASLGGLGAGLHRDEGGTTLEQLQEASRGNLIGNVDEGQCLSLINSLTPSEKTQAKTDTGLMTRLAGALDENEIVQAVNALGFELKWKIYWIDKSGETEAVGGQWQSIFATATTQEIADYIGWNALFLRTFTDIGVNPLLLFREIAGTPDFGSKIAGSVPLMNWIILENDSATALAALGHESFGAGDLETIAGNLMWFMILVGLPRGSGMTPTARAAMRRLKDHTDLANTKMLFEHRFNTEVTGRYENPDGTSSNAVDAVFGDAVYIDWNVADLRSVWDILEFLPDQDVSDSTILDTWMAISGNRGFFSGGDTVQLGMGLSGDSDPERLAHTVRHEVGHAVHRQIRSVVDSWLQSEIGFWYMDSGTSGIWDLIVALGGFPSKYEDADGNKQDFGMWEKITLVGALASHCGDGSKWGSSAPLPDAASPTTDTDRYWAAMPQKVRDCFRLSDPKWYKRYTQMPSGANGKYFYNYWYTKPYYFGATAEAAIGATGDDYSAMSEKEFFANCYAEYFHDEAGYNDHSIWEQCGLPGSVKTFFKDHVLERQPYTPPEGGGESNPTGGEGAGVGGHG